MPEGDEFLQPEDLIELKRTLIAMKRDVLPPVVTHNMVHDADDPILATIRRLHLFNHPSDKVKIIYHPEFLSKDSPILGMDYEEFVRGCHLGVFPSYYEPWGYTPAECVILGLPSITTNLSGFGSYIEEILPNHDEFGIHILDRKGRSVEDSIEYLVSIMIDFCKQSRRQRITQRNRVERLSDLLDWKILGVEYKKARFAALYRTHSHQFPAIVEDHLQNSFEDLTIEKNLATSMELALSPSPKGNTLA